MQTLATVLNGAAAITTSVAPTLGNINSYNATGGALTPTLPALSGLNMGASCIVEKNAADTSPHTITFTTTGGDTFDDTTTNLVLRYTGEKRTLQVVTISGTKQWKVTQVSPSAATPGVALSLLGQGVITTPETPLMGYVNIYNATLGPLSPTLRQAALGTLGTTCLVEIDPNDISGNAVTFICYAGETFSDGSTARTLTVPGSFLVLALLAINGVAQWKVIGAGNSAAGPADTATFDGGSASTVYGAFSFDGGSASTVSYTLTVDGGSASALSGQQGLYIASDGSLHFAGPTTDTVIAPA